MATKKLYDDFPYSRDFSAKILDVKKEDDKKEGYLSYSILLDQTLFFPEAGGQTCDRGKLILDGSSYDVSPVSIDNEGNIYHQILLPIKTCLTFNDPEVHGHLDWNHRFSNMQQHTGEHILSGLIHTLYGFQNVGFHLSDNIVTADFDGFLDESAISQVEEKANDAIYKNLAVTCSYPDSVLLASKNYRSKTDHGDEVRLVEIEGIDLCACCCPHVKSTGEIGLLKILSAIRYKGGTRISFLCGKRALSYFDFLQKQSSSLSKLLSSEKDKLLEIVSNLYQEKESLRAKIRNQNQKLLEISIEKGLASDSLPLLFVEGYSMNEIRSAVNQLVENKKDYCGIFSGNDNDGYTYVLGSKILDSTKVSKAFAEVFEAKGGGKKEMIQGFVKGKKEEILKAIQDLS